MNISLQTYDLLWGLVRGLQCCYNITCCSFGHRFEANVGRVLNWRRQITVPRIVIYGVEYVIVSMSSLNVKSDNLISSQDVFFLKRTVGARFQHRLFITLLTLRVVTSFLEASYCVVILRLLNVSQYIWFVFLAGSFRIYLDSAPSFPD